MLKRHKLGVFLLFVIILAATVTITLVQTPIYEITSTVMIKYGREYIYRPMDKLGKGEVQPVLAFNNDQIINTELEIFRSKELIERTIRSIGLDELYPELNSPKIDHALRLPFAVDTFNDNFSVFHIKSSSVIGISFKHENPELAVRAVTSLTEAFKEKHIQLFKNPQTPFLAEQVSQYSRKLEETENRLKSFKQENTIFALEDQRKLLLQQYINVNTLLIKGQGEASKLKEKVTTLQSGIAEIPEEIVLYDDSIQKNNIESDRTKLLDFILHEKGILEKYKADNRLAIEARKNIERIEEFIEKERLSQGSSRRSGKNHIYLELQKELFLTKADYSAQQAKNVSTKQQLDQLNIELQNFVAKEKQFKKLEREAETAEDNYTNFVSKLEETRILDEMDRQKMANVAVIEKPRIPVKPIKPRKKLNLLIGLILAVTSGLTYALVADYIFIEKKSLPEA